MIYLIIFLLFIFLSYYYDYRGKTKNKQLWYILSLLLLILLAGLRYRLGVDSIRYESSFASTPDLFDLTLSYIKNSRFAVGYILLTSLCRTISSDFIVMQLFHAVIVNSLIFNFFKHNTRNVFFAITVYFVFLYLNFMCEVMRESLAVAVFLVSWKYFVRKSWIRYYICCLISFSFHVSAIITFILPILYLPTIRNLFVIRKRTIFVLCAIFIIVSAIQMTFFNIMQGLITIDSVTERMETYSNTDLSSNRLNINGIISVVIRFIIYPILLKHYTRKGRPAVGNDSEKMVEFMVSICMIMAVLCIPIAIFYRYNNYFFPFEIIFVSSCAFKSIKPKLTIHRAYKKLSFSIWLLFFLPWFGLQIYDLNARVGKSNLREWMRYIPYSTKIVPQKDNNREAVYRYYHAY